MLAASRRAAKSRPARPMAHLLYYPDLMKIYDRSKRNLTVEARLEGCAGFINLRNKIDYNLLRPDVVERLDRAVGSMARDSDVRAAMISCENKVFSKGTDYRTLAHTYAEKKDPEHKYLADMQRFVYAHSKQEFPVITVLDGKCYGSAAVFGVLAPFPMTTKHTNVCFPETSFGYIPTGGSTYLLSRLPGDLGLYLALTGERLLGSDLHYLKLAVEHVTPGRQLNSVFATTANQMPEILGTRRLFGDQWAMYREQKLQKAYVELIGDITEVQNRTNLLPSRKHWKKHRENVRMVLADVIYKQMLEKDANEDMQQYREFKGQPIVNHLLNFEVQFLPHVEKACRNNFTHEKFQAAIHRCFSAPTLEDLWARLDCEESAGERDWARYTKDQLKSKAPLALATTFKLIKEAASLQWYECLEREFAAAANLASHPDFMEGVTTVLRGKGNAKWQTKLPVSSDQLAEVCSGPKLDLGAKHNELLPSREYFRKIPAAPRLWLNELSTDQLYLREDYEYDVQHFFNSLDIDIRNTMLTQELVRKVFFNYHNVSRRVESEVSRVKAVSRDLLSRQIFVSLREKAVRDYFSNEEEATKKVQQLLERGFREAFHERLEQAKTHSEAAHRMEKQKFLKELKEFVAEKRIVLTKTQKEDITSMEMFETLQKLPMTFPKDNSENFLDKLSTASGKRVQASDFFSILEYKHYLLAAPSPNENYSELKRSLYESLQSAKELLEETMNYIVSRIDPEYVYSKETNESKLVESVTDFENFRRLIESVKKEKEDKLDVLPVLLAEVYVKFGATSIQEALEFVRKKEPIDLAGMKERRRALINSRLSFDPSVHHPAPEVIKLKKMFSELYVVPDNAEVDDVLAAKLEMESAQNLLVHARTMQEMQRIRARERSNPLAEFKKELEEEEERGGEALLDSKSDEEDLSPEVKNPSVTDFTSSVLLDHIYLEATLGDRAYLPQTWSDCITEVPPQFVQIGSFTESPEEWVLRALAEVVKEALGQRAGVEKFLTRSELISYDQTFFKTFEVSSLKKLVLQKLYTESNFLRDICDSARSDLAAKEQSEAQMLKPPALQHQDSLDMAEGLAISHALDLKRKREEGLPKAPIQMDFNSEIVFAEVREAEKQAGIKPQLTQEEIDEARASVPTLTVQEEYARHRQSVVNLRSMERRLVESQHMIAALKVLVAQQKYRQRLKDPAAVEALLKEREESVS